jgi:hypothetical protein
LPGRVSLLDPGGVYLVYPVCDLPAVKDRRIFQITSEPGRSSGLSFSVTV